MTDLAKKESVYIGIIKNPEEAGNILDDMRVVQNKCMNILSDLEENVLEDNLERKDDGTFTTRQLDMLVKYDLARKNTQIKAIDSISKLSKNIIYALEVASKIQERERITSSAEWEKVMAVLQEMFMEDPALALTFQNKLRQKGFDKKKAENLSEGVAYAFEDFD